MVSVFNNDDDNQNEQDQVILDNFLNFFNKNKNNDLKQWVKNFDEPNGFMFTEADEITTICNACDPKAELANSIVWFLRECQHIFQNE
jgi:hypothetical protein